MVFGFRPESRSPSTGFPNELHYSRTYERKDVRIPLEKLGDLKEFYSEIMDDERGYAILRVP